MAKTYNTTKKPKGHARNVIGVNKETYELITEKAKEAGVSRSELVRAVFQAVKEKKMIIKSKPVEINVEIA